MLSDYSRKRFLLERKSNWIAPGEVVLTEKIVVPVDENPGVSLAECITNLVSYY